MEDYLTQKFAIVITKSFFLHLIACCNNLTIKRGKRVKSDLKKMALRMLKVKLRNEMARNVFF